jgi:phosphopantothenate--cysteine ligase
MVELKHILITSGGTLVPIDPVRSISNSSTGRFGTQLGTAALKAGMRVTYLTSKNGQSPFSANLNCYESSDWDTQLKNLIAFADQHRHLYTEHRYQTFDDYASQLQDIIEQQKPDIVMLAAAVSDYLVANYSMEKVRSSDNLAIQLKPAQKLIQFVRAWSPDSYIVGFKLLVDVSDAELVAAAKTNMEKFDLDLVVANDLSSIKRGAHEVIIVERNGHFQKITDDLAEAIINKLVRVQK